MSLVGRIAIVILVWAAIYLPGLGTLELKGEEGRRVLPAMQMLATGNFLVPQVGSEPYIRKPPLINWLAAASFAVFGARNEWTGRLPSVISVLAVALVLATACRKILGGRLAMLAALMWLTCFGLLEKGRLIEIEALYVSLTAVALVLWLTFWMEKRSPWQLWVVPSVFLGLGLLTKGPVHLLFYYSVVVGVLWKNNELRQLFRPAHLVSLLVTFGIFAAWAIPCLLAVDTDWAQDVWSRQFTSRTRTATTDWSDWLLNMPKGLLYFLPWTLLLPFVRWHRFNESRARATAIGLAWGIVVPFVAVSLLPGALPRYTMPLLGAAIWGAALALREDAFAWLKNLPRKIEITVAVVCLGMLVYGFGIVPRLAPKAKLRPLAERINSVVPGHERLFAVNPNYQPYFFYLKAPVVYVNNIAELPPDARFIWSDAVDADKLEGQGAVERLEFRDYRRWGGSILERPHAQP